MDIYSLYGRMIGKRMYKNYRKKGLGQTISVYYSNLPAGIIAGCLTYAVSLNPNASLDAMALYYLLMPMATIKDHNVKKNKPLEERLT